MTTATGTVYILTDPRHGAIRYVGATTQSLSVRLSGHLGKGTNAAVIAWLGDLVSAGLKPGISAIATVPVSDLAASEREAIAEHHRAGWPLLNINDVPTVSMEPLKLLEARVEKARMIGGSVLADAENALSSYLERKAELARMHAERWPTERDKFPMAVHRHLAPYLISLDPDDQATACAVAEAMICAAADRGMTFKEAIRCFPLHLVAEGLLKKRGARLSDEVNRSLAMAAVTSALGMY